MQLHMASLRFSWKVKHDEAEEHTQNNLESINENSAVPEGVTEAVLNISVEAKCCNILDVNSDWASIDLSFHRLKFSSSPSRFRAPPLEFFDATCVFNPGIIFSEVEARE